MYSIPHTFPSLVDLGDHPRPVLLIGAGMSNGIAPMPHELLKELAPKQQEIEQRLSCQTGYTLGSDPPNLYEWAGYVIDGLEKAGLSESDAKRRLADEIGILRDPRFRAQVDIPLRGNTPRHRVVARLVREARWTSIWSLNWDVVLESALESVGLTQDTNGTPRLPQKWPEWFAAWTQPDPVPTIGNKTFRLIKPHGCVSKLLNGHSTFLIATKELGSIGAQWGPNHAWLQSDFMRRPLVTAGWRASEGYIQDIVRDTMKKGTLGATGQADTLSIVDIRNEPWPEQASLMTCYGKDKGTAYVQIEKTQFPLLDDLFIWLQTRYGLNCLVKIFDGKDQEIANTLRGHLEVLKAPDCGLLFNKWFDDFLPVWVRLCFNSGRLLFVVNANNLPSNAIPTHRRDEHIPWGDHDVLRPDLSAAGYLLNALLKSDRNWDFSEFPGGLWDISERRLILPLPAWKPERPLQLSALKPLVESRHWSHKGKIKHLSILPVSDDPNQNLPNVNTTMNWQGQIAQMMKSAWLGNPENIQVVDLEALRSAT